MSTWWRTAVAGAAVLGLTGAATSVTIAARAGDTTDELAVAVAILAYTAVAVVVVIARPAQPVGRLLLLGAVAWGVGEGLLALGVQGLVHEAGSVPAAAWLGVVGTAVRGLGWLVLVVAVPLVFPDGRSPWPGRRLPVAVVAGAIGLFTIATLLAPTPLETRLEDVDSPTGFPPELQLFADLLALGALALCGAGLALAVAGLVRRWRRGDALRRQQLLWFGVAFAVPLAFLPLVATPVAEPWMFALVTIPGPVAIGVALLQRRLYDVQLVVSRTLTYLALSASVAALYALTVGGIGALLEERGAPWLPWVAAGVVAVSFAPLRNALQQAVTRLTYGQWAQPADVLAATGRRLADAADVTGLLRVLTDELGQSLGLRHVEIADVHGRPLARYGAPGEDGEELLLSAYGAPVGALRWAGRRLRPVDRALLDDLAHQLGGVVHAHQLVDTIRQGQERLVLAREEERRRLRRDLHDGLGPELATLGLHVDTLRNRVAADDATLELDEELLRLREAIQATVVDVRRVVEGLRPPALDELGVADALGQLVDRIAATAPGHVVLRTDPLPRLPAAVEVALYRVAQEALTNAVRHARATHVDLEVRLERGGVGLTVRDDGSGTVAERPGGVGLTSMRERAEEISGTFSVECVPGVHTTVAIWLPLHAAPYDRDDSAPAVTA